jgi:CRP-like cAMP-binding protein
MSLLANEVDLLRRVPLFAGIEPSKLRLLAYTSDVVTFRQGKRLFRKGDPGDAAFIIISGEAEVIVSTDSGEIPVAVLRDGDFLGEIAILCDVARTATVRARSELKTLKISKDTLLQIIRQFPEIGIEVMRTLAHRLSHTTAELVETQLRLRDAQAVSDG